MTRDGRRPECRRGPASRAWRALSDAEEVFRTAILAGVLSAERARSDWAGRSLCLAHDEDGTAWFKHRDTRAYVSIPARRCAAECGR